MPREHQTFCDGRHRTRQACNDALLRDHVSPPPTATYTATAVNDEPAAGTEGNAVPVAILEPDERDEVGDVVALEPDGPSPRVARAWAETAAAVGATASPPSPVRPIIDRPEPVRRPYGQALVVATFVAVLVLVLLRRR